MDFSICKASITPTCLQLRLLRPLKRRSKGPEAFWSRIRGRGDFYRNLPLIADAMDLYEAVAHLKPIILTGCPECGWSEPQKIAWAAHHFPNVTMITCRSKDKHLWAMGSCRSPAAYAPRCGAPWPAQEAHLDTSRRT